MRHNLIGWNHGVPMNVCMLRAGIDHILTKITIAKKYDVHLGVRGERPQDQWHISPRRNVSDMNIDQLIVWNAELAAQIDRVAVINRGVGEYDRSGDARIFVH